MSTRRRQREAAERQQEERERQREWQMEQQREQQALQQAFNQKGQLDEGWMEDILGTDDLEDRLDEYQIQKIQGLINKQWILANLSEAQTHDRWHKLDVMKMKVLGEFPPGESHIQGPIRGALKNEEMEQLFALTAEERNIIDQIFTSLQNMVTRSTDGFERQQVNTSIARTESENKKQSDSSSGLRGLFSN